MSCASIEIIFPTCHMAGIDTLLALLPRKNALAYARAFLFLLRFFNYFLA